MLIHGRSSLMPTSLPRCSGRTMHDVTAASGAAHWHSDFGQRVSQRRGRHCSSHCRYRFWKGQYPPSGHRRASANGSPPPAGTRCRSCARSDAHWRYHSRNPHDRPPSAPPYLDERSAGLRKVQTTGFRARVKASHTSRQCIRKLEPCSMAAVAFKFKVATGE